MSDTHYVRGAERLQRRIATIRRNLNLPEMVEEISQLLLRRNLDRFDKQQDPDGRRWRPLSPTTLLIKRKLGFGGRPSLVRTGSMRSSIQVIRGSAAGSTYVNTGAGRRIGVVGAKMQRRAQAHMYGTERIPIRRFLGIGRLDVKAVDSLLRRRAQKLEKL